MPHAAPSPLTEIHRQADAEMQAYDAVEIVSTFGEPQAEYSAIRKAAGLFDLSQRGLIELTGRDRHAFLNNLVSNQLYDKAAKTPLAAGRWAYAFLLNLKGRIVCDLNVIEVGGRTLLEVDGRLASMLVGLLDRYLFAEQVKVRDATGELYELALHGPLAADVLRSEGIDFPAREPDATAQTVNLGASDASSPTDSRLAPHRPSSDASSVTPPGPNACFDANIIGVPVTVWRDDPCGVPGYHLILPRDRVADVWHHLLTRHGQGVNKRTLRPIGWAAFNATRIEAGRPLVGIDFELAPPSSPGKKADADDAAARPVGVLPAETGLLDRAVSFTKGCYLGQEVVARMHARGQVARRWVGLRIDAGALPIAGAHLLDDKDAVVGMVTSSTMSPVLSDAAIALAVLKRPLFEPGSRVRVQAEGSTHNATVVPTPFLQQGPL